MNEDTMKAIINDVVDLAIHTEDHMMGPALEDIASRLEKLDAVAANPPMSEGVKNRGLVGIRFNDTSIVAWNLVDNKDIRVTARKINGNCWHIAGYAADTLRISAAVFGGKNATLRYVRFIRNGLMSRVMRRKGRVEKLKG